VDKAACQAWIVAKVKNLSNFSEQLLPYICTHVSSTTLCVILNSDVELSLEIQAIDLIVAAIIVIAG
jgi:hypothetical protein